MQLNANKILKDSGETIQYQDINETTDEGKEYLQAIKDETVEGLGFFLKPSELFSSIATRGKQTKDEENNEEEETNTLSFILGDLANVLRNIEQSTIYYSEGGSSSILVKYILWIKMEDSKKNI